MPTPRGARTPSPRQADRRLTLAIYIVIALLSLAAFWPLVESQRLASSGRAAAERGDYAEAIEAWTPLAEAGDVDAQFSLGVMLDRGLGTAEDPVAAAGWYRNLGLMYILGRGVEADDAAAARLFRYAADANVPEGLANLGHLYRAGRGVARDPARGYALLRRGALLGNGTAALGVAEMLASGEGVDSDPVEALAWAEFTAGLEQSESARAAQLATALAADMDSSERREATALAARIERQLHR
jgi:TPR repeat protein